MTLPSKLHRPAALIAAPKIAVTRKKVAFTEFDRPHPIQACATNVGSGGAARLSADFFIANHVAAATSCTLDPGKLDSCSRATRQIMTLTQLHHAWADAAGIAEPNSTRIKTRSRSRAGATMCYPEVSTMMQLNRRAVRASAPRTISLKAYRALRGTEIHLHIGSLGSRFPRRAVNRSFLIGGWHGIASYGQDPMFHIDFFCRGGESYRESPPPTISRQNRRDIDLPWAASASTICYTCVSPLYHPALARKRASFLSPCLRLHPQDRRGALAYAVARPRHRERCFVSRRRPRPCTRTSVRLWSIR